MNITYTWEEAAEDILDCINMKERNEAVKILAASLEAASADGFNEAIVQIYGEC